MGTDVHQLNIVYSAGDQFAENILHWKNALTNSANPDMDSADLMSHFQSTMQTGLLACLPNDCSIEGYRCKRINNGGGPTVTVVNSGVVGTRSGATVTSGSGPCLTWPYNAGTRWRTGRTFLPGIAAGDYTDNEPVTGLLTALNALVTLFLAGLGSTTPGPWVFGVWSPKGTLLFPITLGVVSGKVGTQRRRYTPVI
jgi:hypothetical protein